MSFSSDAKNEWGVFPNSKRTPWPKSSGYYNDEDNNDEKPTTPTLKSIAEKLDAQTKLIHELMQEICKLKTQITSLTG